MSLELPDDLGGRVYAAPETGDSHVIRFPVHAAGYLDVRNSDSAGEWSVTRRVLVR